VLLRAADAGVGPATWENESFAYADSYDEDAKRYRGLFGGQGFRRRNSLSDCVAGLVGQLAVTRADGLCERRVKALARLLRSGPADTSLAPVAR